jgi:hypothetical protein
LRSSRCNIFLPNFLAGIRCRFPPSSGFGLKPSQGAGVISPEQCKEVHMKKAFAVLATIVTVGATTITAPAQARGFGRGIGPGLAFGLAAGAIAAGAYGPYYGMGPATAITVPAITVITDRPITDPDLTPTMAGRITGIATIATGDPESPEHRSGLFA